MCVNKYRICVIHESINILFLDFIRKYNALHETINIVLLF